MMKVVPKFNAGQWMLWVLLAFSSAVSFAQTDTGSLAGTILDASGGVVAGAQVTATEATSGTVYKTTSSSSGAYVFTSIRPGSYTAGVAAASFATAQVTALPIFVGTRAAQDFKLAAGATTETITVVANRAVA